QAPERDGDPGERCRGALHEERSARVPAPDGQLSGTGRHRLRPALPRLLDGAELLPDTCPERVVAPPLADPPTGEVHLPAEQVRVTQVPLHELTGVCRLRVEQRVTEHGTMLGPGDDEGTARGRLEQ